MRTIYKISSILATAFILSSCGELNDLACNTHHPACVEPSIIKIHNTSRSEEIHTVNIEKHCATSWSNTETEGIARGASNSYEVEEADLSLLGSNDEPVTYDVRVLYSNGTCDYKYDVKVTSGENEISVYRSHFNCPAPCA